MPSMPSWMGGRWLASSDRAEGLDDPARVVSDPALRDLSLLDTLRSVVIEKGWIKIDGDSLFELGRRTSPLVRVVIGAGNTE